MQSASVSVAIPVLNGARYLREAILSVTAQTTAVDEILVFDNASTDSSRAIARALLGDAAVRGSDANNGASWNFSRAATSSTGRYFAWLGADDRLRPHFVEEAVAALERSGGAACLTGIRFIDTSGHAVGEQRDLPLADPSARRRLRAFLRRPRWTESYCMYRRDVLLTSPMFSPDFGADVLLTWWFLLRGPLTVIEEPLVEYRVYATKSMEAQSQDLTPGTRRVDWRMLRLWRALWGHTASGDVAPAVRRAARLELLLALTGRHWLKHNAADALRFAQFRVPLLRRWRNLL